MPRDASYFFAPAGIVTGFFFLALLGGALLPLGGFVTFLDQGAKLPSQHSVSFLNFSEFRVEFLELGRAGNDGLLVDFPKDAIVVGNSGLNLMNGSAKLMAAMIGLIRLRCSLVVSLVGVGGTSGGFLILKGHWCFLPLQL